MRDVVKDFDGLRALDHCSLEVERGSITGLIGPNGAGKTTLFDIVSGALSPTSGSVIFSGRRIDRMRMHETFRLGLVRTFQIPRELKRMTVLENLMLVPAPQPGESVWASWFTPWRVTRAERAIEAKAAEVMEFVNLSPLADEYAANLSAGQKKLLELARTLMAEPSLVLLDEPAAGVNRSLLADITDNIRRASEERGVSFLLIEHDMGMVMRLCDPIIVMASGAVIERGTPSEIQRSQRVIEAYLGGSASAAAGGC